MQVFKFLSLKSPNKKLELVQIAYLEMKNTAVVKSVQDIEDSKLKQFLEKYVRTGIPITHTTPNRL